MNSISVFITDNDNLLINSLVKLFREFDEITFAGRANSSKQCLERLQGKLPDVILMDIRMEHPRAGIETARKILNRYKKNAPKLIFLTVSEKVEDVADAFTNNIPYINKSIDIQELVNFILKVYKGEYTGKKTPVYLPNGKTDAIQGEIKNNIRQDILNSLGRKQLLIMCLISQGDDRIEIAQKMNLSITTVHTHVRNIKNRLEDFGLKNDVKIAQFVEKYNLYSEVDLSKYE